MGLRLEANETFSAGLKRIMHEQTDKALNSLQTLEPSLDEAIHDARKRFKKLRACVRLVRDEIGSDIYKRENVAYRDAGRALSDVRDAYSFLETLNAIADEIDAGDDDELQEDIANMREKLKTAHEDEVARIQENDVIAGVIEDIQEAKARIDDLPIDSNGFDAIDKSLKRVYKRGRKGFKNSYNQSGIPDIEEFHEWRKRVKYLMYQLRILEPLWEDMLDELEAEVHDLSDFLGDAHDLAEMYQRINEWGITDDGGGRRLLAYLDYERAKMERAAKPLGMRVYAEKKKRFVKRIGKYWDAWQLERDMDTADVEPMDI